MDTIYITGISSLIIQLITGIFDFYVLHLKVPKEVMILKQVLFLEFVVQIIEFTFYVWMIYNFNKLDNITPSRYWDWALTTPTMLISLCIYLIYLKNIENKKVIEENIIQVIFENATVIIPVVVLNFFMLIFGYLGETKVIPFKLATIFGFMPFLLYFYLIYENLAKFSVYGMRIFFMFSFIWALYGVANLLSYKVKNTLYNILDLFSKNFFGLFIAGILYFESKKVLKV
jgi:hypothetical protein